MVFFSAHQFFKQDTKTLPFSVRLTPKSVEKGGFFPSTTTFTIISPEMFSQIDKTPPKWANTIKLASYQVFIATSQRNICIPRVRMPTDTVLKPYPYDDCGWAPCSHQACSIQWVFTEFNARDGNLWNCQSHHFNDGNRSTLTFGSKILNIHISTISNKFPSFSTYLVV